MLLAPAALLTAATLNLPQATTPPRTSTQGISSSQSPLTLPAFTGYAHPDPEREQRNDDGSIARCEGSLVFYVHLAQAGDLQVTLQRLAAPGGDLITTVEPWGDRNTPTAPPSTTTTLSALKSAADDPLGTFAIHGPGYHRISLRFADGAPLRNLHSLTLSGSAAVGAHANQKERRNAASVHLGYPVPADRRDQIQWFYLEVTPRTDPLWTYYMATGWHRGYFGMQVNSKTERRLIFSVWDAGDEPTDRDKVAAKDRVELLAKGDGVVAERFGHEGTGGHSHLVQDWQPGQTYRFLLHAAPDGTHTTYTGWFWFAAERRWGLLASFRAPRDGKLLHGLYSFSENFAGQNGDALRHCEFGNAWVKPANGTWLQLRDARFTHDPTGERDRLDRCGGVSGDRFYLRQGGFAANPAGAATASSQAIRLPNDSPAGSPPNDAELPTPPSGEKPR